MRTVDHNAGAGRTLVFRRCSPSTSESTCAPHAFCNRPETLLPRAPYAPESLIGSILSRKLARLPSGKVFPSTQVEGGESRLWARTTRQAGKHLVKLSLHTPHARQDQGRAPLPPRVAGQPRRTCPQPHRISARRSRDPRSACCPRTPRAGPPRAARCSHRPCPWQRRRVDSDGVISDLDDQTKDVIGSMFP